MSDRRDPEAEQAPPDSERQTGDLDPFENGFEGELPEYMRSTKPSRVWLSSLDLERPED